jgi:uncharacterized protein (TIGR02001 family)
MTKFSKTLLAGSLLAASSGVAQAEVSANIAAVTDYLFRGVNQTDGAAVQGGFDYAADMGLYAGTWMSNVDFGGKEDSEVDLYAGYGGEAGALGYDAGLLYYWYPGAGGDAQGGELDYAEVYANLSIGMFGAGAAYTFWGETDDAPFDTGDWYYSVSMDIPVGPIGLGLFAGRYDFEEKAAGNDTASYNHYGLSLTKDVGDFGSVNMNFEKNDIEDDEGPQVWLGWAKEF